MAKVKYDGRLRRLLGELERLQRERKRTESSVPSEVITVDENVTQTLIDSLTGAAADLESHRITIEDANILREEAFLDEPANVTETLAQSAVITGVTADITGRITDDITAALASVQAVFDSF